MKFEQVRWTMENASKELRVPPYVLRYWEKEFALNIKRSRGGQRRYDKKTMGQLREIIRLLRTEGFTIKGAKKKLWKNQWV